MSIGKLFLPSLALVVATTVACASSARRPDPVLYPNRHLSETGRTEADRVVRQCDSLADEYVKAPTPQGDTARQGVGGAALGAGAGALTGAITGGSIGRSVGAGAAVGGLLGTARGATSGTDHTAYQQFMTACLRDQGFDVAGWQ